MNLLEIETEDEKQHEHQDEDIQIAFNLQKDLPKEIGELKVLYFEKERQEDGSMKKELREISREPCKRDMFFGREEDLVKYPWETINAS